MKGNTQIIAALNDLLSYELAAMDQYFIHSRMYEDWGINKLFERINHEFDDEKLHASMLIQRILFLEGIPDIQTRQSLNIGKTVPEMLQNDLDVENADAKALRAAIGLCEQEKDYVTGDILKKLLDDTEVDHAFWLGQQLGLIKTIGLQNYIQSQL